MNIAVLMTAVIGNGFAPILPGGGEYVAEDGSTFYVSEDGATLYVAEDA